MRQGANDARVRIFAWCARGGRLPGRVALGIFAALALGATSCDSTATTGSDRSKPRSNLQPSDTASSSDVGKSVDGAVIDESVTGSTAEVLQTSPKVTIRTIKDSFRSGDPVVAVIRNKRSTSITATSGQSSCSIATLQRRSGDEWQTEGHCEEGAPPANIPVEPESHLRVEIGGRNGDERFSVGTYRAVFTYRLGNSEQPTYVSFSKTFEIID